MTTRDQIQEHAKIAAGKVHAALMEFEEMTGECAELVVHVLGRRYVSGSGFEVGSRNVTSVRVVCHEEMA